jgi:hypothetical protein
VAELALGPTVFCRALVLCAARVLDTSERAAGFDGPSRVLRAVAVRTGWARMSVATAVAVEHPFGEANRARGVMAVGNAIRPAQGRCTLLPFGSASRFCRGRPGRAPDHPVLPITLERSATALAWVAATARSFAGRIPRNLCGVVLCRVGTRNATSLHPRSEISAGIARSESALFQAVQVVELRSFDTGLFADLHQAWRLEEGTGARKRRPLGEVDDSVGVTVGAKNEVALFSGLLAHRRSLVEHLLPGWVVLDGVNDQYVVH